MYYGFLSERRTINGKTGSVLVPSPQAESVKIAYELYQRPDISHKDIIFYFREHDIDTARPIKLGSDKVGNMDRSHLGRILRSPLYVRADKDVYAYFAAKGYEMLDDVEDYDGVHGIFYHKTPDGIFIKLGYHEGLVDARTWLAVQDKKDHQEKFPNNRKVLNSWLIGLMKCGNCGYAMHINHSTGSRGQMYRNFFDYGRYTVAGCSHDAPTAIRPQEVEDAVLQAMRDRIESLVIAKTTPEIPDAETESLKADILHIDDEIHKLMDKLADADEILFDYIQQRVKVLHEQKSGLERKLQTKTRKRKAIDTTPLEEPMSRWDSLTMQEKHDLAVSMIEVIYIILVSVSKSNNKKHLITENWKSVKNLTVLCIEDGHSKQIQKWHQKSNQMNCNILQKEALSSEISRNVQSDSN